VYTSVEFQNSDNLVCNSFDGLTLNLDLSYQFVPNMESLRDLTLLYQNFTAYNKMVQMHSRGTITHVCGDFTAEEFQSRRSDVAESMENELVSVLYRRFHANVARFQLRNVDRPSLYESIVKEKENARSEIRLAENEQEQAVVAAETKKNQAEQFRERTINKGFSDGNITVTAAENFAAGVRDRFDAFAEVYTLIQTEYGFDTAGTLSYIANELFSDDRTVLGASNPSAMNFLERL